MTNLCHGTYIVFTTDNNGCTAQDTFTIKLATSVEEIYSYLPIISPNPTTSQFTIKTFNIIDEIKITDVLGQLIYHAKPKDKNLSLYLENEGIYFVTVTLGGQMATKKLVINSATNYTN